MIVKEFFRYNEDLQKNLYRTYSDEGYYIKQIETGNIYEEAVDIEAENFTYEETNEKIVIPDENQENQDIEVY